MWAALLLGVMFCVMSENLVEGQTFGCFNDSEVEWSRIIKHLPRPHPHRHRHQRLRSLYTDIGNRSLAPWRLQVTEKLDRFPPLRVEALCVYEGCLIGGVENHSYNSVPVEQYQLFVKRIPCHNDTTKYSLELMFEPVQVACACVTSRR